jgi:hypothetical protein
MRKTTRWTSLLAAAMTATLALAAAAPPASAGAPDQADGIEAYERDVFVIVGSTLRNPDATTDPSAPLFSISGVNLNVTWGEWSAASATSVVRTSGKAKSARTDVRLSFSSLVPGGVYSVFWGTLLPDSENPLCPGVERTLALPSTDPAQSPDASSFVAGADGTAAFRGALNGDLLSANQVYFSIVYHFDGQTWGALPNHGEFNTQGPECRSSFGDDAMRQMLVLQKW